MDRVQQPDFGSHSDGIKIIVDWAQNHSNPNNGGENGALYNNGTLMATPGNDPNGLFHHTGTSSITTTATRCSMTTWITFRT